MGFVFRFTKIGENLEAFILDNNIRRCLSIEQFYQLLYEVRDTTL